MCQEDEVGYQEREVVEVYPCAVVQLEAHGALALREERLDEDAEHDHSVRKLHRLVLVI